MPTIKEHHAANAANPNSKAVAVVTALDNVTDCHTVRVQYKGVLYEVDGQFDTLEEAHDAGHQELSRLGYRQGHPDSYS